MKEILQAMARYSVSVDQSLVDLLQPLTKDQLTMQTKAYYPSVFETLMHVLISSLNWCKRYGNIFKEGKAFTKSKLLTLDEKGLRKEFESDPSKLYPYLRQVDDTILQFVSELDDKRLASVIKYKNYKGEEIEKELWKTLLQCFTHQAHHRGQISVLLDILGIDNDYSSVLPRI